jgi:hypothetical protein
MADQAGPAVRDADCSCVHSQELPLAEEVSRRFAGAAQQWAPVRSAAVEATIIRGAPCPVRGPADEARRARPPAFLLVCSFLI